jgi:hypothetical protein
MPGREDLIKENNARAYAAANTPQPQESAGKSVSSSVGGPRSLLGGNLDVFSALDKVEFQGSLGDGSLRGNVAYIRMWKRGGSAQQAASTQQTVEPPKSDTLQILQEDLEAAIGNRDNVTNGFNPYEDVDNPIEVAEANIQIAENRLSEEKQKAISTQTPTSSKVASTTAIAVPQSAKTTTPSTPSVGAVKSANPSGFLNTLTNRGDGVGLPQGKVKYSGKLTENSSSATGKALGEMMWQFLFNPSELELDVGPEFKDAETWGVSDKGNSGKPLHWSHNKNAQLKFNSVLLNGFVFGRKVEALEQGLIELFMAREGEGQHGPHVLEFVWGKRVFGPCVIKNVNIKEKMWDEGEVVNAEVSFTLEQVPEWTINDGFVDVARPGRQQLATNPAAGATGAAGAPPGPGAPGAPAAPGGGGAPDQKPPQKQDPTTGGSAYRTCQKAFELAEVFVSIMYREGPSAKANFNRQNGVVLGDQVLSKYKNAYSQASSSVGTNFTRRVPQQYTPASTENSLRSMRQAGAMFDKQIDLITTAASKSREAMLNVWNGDCKKIIADGKAAQIGAQNANSKQALCSGITVGRSCNIGAGNFSPKNPCSGKVLRCNGRGKYEAI